jgi:hypothetical protein
MSVLRNCGREESRSESKRVAAVVFVDLTLFSSLIETANVGGRKKSEIRVQPGKNSSQIERNSWMRFVPFLPLALELSGF